MSKISTYLKQSKLLLATLLFCIVVVSCTLLISLIQIHGVSETITSFSSWISAHKSYFLVWHMLIIVAIYYTWGLKVQRDAKRYSLTDSQTKKAKQFRYYLIAFVVVIDLLIYWR